MDGQQADFRKAGCGSNRPGHGVRDVVELQIEKDSEPEGRQPFDRRRPLSRKELAANLEDAGHASKLARQGAGRPQGVNVQGDD